MVDVWNIELECIGEKFVIDQKKKVVRGAGKEEVPIVWRILMLHYLVMAKDKDLTAKKRDSIIILVG